MKPHEETLVVAAENSDQSALVSVSDDRMVCVFRAQEAEDWIRLMQQAPAMARALLETLKWCPSCSGSGEAHVRCPTGYERHPCPTCEDHRRVLTDAGVLP